MPKTPFSLRNAAGFDPVREAFIKNFSDFEEHAAGFAVYKDGERLIDFVGGWADRKKTEALTRDHLIAVFSSGKAMATLAIAWLAEEDRLGLDQEVRSFWPEFDRFGKGHLTVAQVMSHQSGLSGISNPEWTPADWYDWNKTIAELERQEPLWDPGTASGYGPITFGFLAGEIARRTDHDGRNIGRILREEISDRFDLDIWIGLPESEHERCADMIKPRTLAEFGEINAATRAAFLQKWSSPGGHGPRIWRMAELAGSNCHGTADSLAKAMSLFINGSLNNMPFLSEDIREGVRKTRISGPNLVLPFDVDFASGVMKNHPNYFFGPNAETIGHSGWGGSCVFADPESGLSGAYVMTRQENSLLGDQRPRNLIDAVYACL